MFDHIKAPRKGLIKSDRECDPLNHAIIVRALKRTWTKILFPRAKELNLEHTADLIWSDLKNRIVRVRILRFGAFISRVVPRPFQNSFVLHRTATTATTFLYSLSMHACTRDALSALSPFWISFKAKLQNCKTCKSSVNGFAIQKKAF